MPLNTSPKASAAERRAALIAERDALAAHRDAVQAKRDAASPSHPDWRRANSELRDLADELRGYDDAIAAIGPEVEAETREAHHAHAVAQHARAVEAAAKADALVAGADRHLSKAVACIRAYLHFVPDCAAVGGVEPHPYRLGETVPEMQHFRDVFLARLVAAGILDPDFMPQHIADAPAAFNDARAAGVTWPGQAPPDPMKLAASASFAALHDGFKRALAAADPDRQKREREYLAAMSRERAAREAAEMSKPLPKLPAPPPAVVHAPAIVIGR